MTKRKIGYRQLERSLTPLRAVMWVGLAFLVEAIKWASLIYSAIALVLLGWTVLEGYYFMGAYKFAKKEASRLEALKLFVLGD